jgi:hypothetical protein
MTERRAAGPTTRLMPSPAETLESAFEDFFLEKPRPEFVALLERRARQPRISAAEVEGQIRG